MVVIKVAIENKWNVTSTYGSKGRILTKQYLLIKLQMSRWMSKVEFTMKAALIMELNIFSNLYSNFSQIY